MSRLRKALIGGLIAAAAALATATDAQEHGRGGGGYHGGGEGYRGGGYRGEGPRGGFAAPQGRGGYAAVPAPAPRYAPGYGPPIGYAPRNPYAPPVTAPRPIYPGYPGYVVGGRRPNSLGEGWALQQEEARTAVRGGRMAPLGRVIETIGRRTPGRQLDTGIEYEGGRAIYRVRWITTHGRRVDFLVDAASGAILGER